MQRFNTILSQVTERVKKLLRYSPLRSVVQEHKFSVEKTIAIVYTKHAIREIELLQNRMFNNSNNKSINLALLILKLECLLDALEWGDLNNYPFLDSLQFKGTEDFWRYLT
jgi:hypothetical protein